MILERTFEGLSPHENDMAGFYVWMAKKVVDNWLNTGTELKYYYDNWGPSVPKSFESLEEKDQYFQSQIEYYTASAREHYLTRQGAYHEQAIQEAEAAGHEINFQGDVALSVTEVDPKVKK